MNSEKCKRVIAKVIKKFPKGVTFLKEEDKVKVSLDGNFSPKDLKFILRKTQQIKNDDRKNSDE